MSDLIERLRNSVVRGRDFAVISLDTPPTLPLEAADEIERLRRELEELKTLAGKLTSEHCEWRQRDLALTKQLAEARETIDLAARTLRGDGVDDQGEAYDKAQRILDAFLNKRAT